MLRPVFCMTILVGLTCAVPIGGTSLSDARKAIELKGGGETVLFKDQNAKAPFEPVIVDRTYDDAGSVLVIDPNAGIPI